MKQFRPAKKRITVSTGESVRIIRELQGLTRINSRSVQAFLRPLFQRSRTTASAWAWSARRCSRALQCHPAVLVFPGWEDHLQTAA